MILALHAPLFNMWHGEYPYFLREQACAADQNLGFWHSPGAARPCRRTGAPCTTHIRLGSPRQRPSRAGHFVKRGDPGPAGLRCLPRAQPRTCSQLLAGRGTARKADVVLAGHTHHHNELTVRRHRGSWPACMDHYTTNPATYYPTAWVSDEDWRDLVVDTTGSRQPPHRQLRRTRRRALSWRQAAWPMPVPARHRQVVQVPPYPDPLNTSADPRAWWAAHRPLVLQTGALGPLENPGQLQRLPAAVGRAT